MKYALGNMLNGAGSLNPDGLSLDLQFAADRTLTARKGPTPTFTRASTATFVGSNGLIQSAAVNQPRFDHDTASPFACRGLLIEEQRTNSVFPSEALTTQTRTVTAVPHTLSFYGTGTVVLSGVAIATVTGTGAYPTRTTLTFTPTAGSLTLTVTGSVTQAQLEAGSFPTSYIPTTIGPATRSADVCSITGSDFNGFWNRFAGTCVIGAGSSQSTGGRWISNNLAGRTLEIFGSSNISFLEISGVNVVGIATSATYPNTLCLAYAVNDYQSAYNGAISGSDNNTGGTIPNPSELHIGNLGGVADRFTGHIRFVRYFKKRLPNAKLQSLTAP
jgi:hypothetical protein